MAYPGNDNQQVKEANLRQYFMKNINHPLISARLREHPEMTIDQLLDLAVLLESCYEASKVPAYQVNAIDNKNKSAEDAEVSSLANMVERMAVNQIQHANQQYQYNGSMAPAGLSQQNEPTRPYRPWQQNRTILNSATPSNRYGYRPQGGQRLWNSPQRYNPKRFPNNNRNNGYYPTNRKGNGRAQFDNMEPREPTSNGQGTTDSCSRGPDDNNLAMNRFTPTQHINNMQNFWRKQGIQRPP